MITPKRATVLLQKSAEASLRLERSICEYDEGYNVPQAEIDTLYSQLRQAVSKIFYALTGRKPTPDEIESIIGKA